MFILINIIILDDSDHHTRSRGIAREREGERERERERERVSVGMWTHLTDPRDVVSCSLLYQVHKIIVVIWVCSDICNCSVNFIGKLGPVSFL